jgi:hypothetical protein
MNKSYKEEVVDQAILGLVQGGYPEADSLRMLLERIYECGYNEHSRQLTESVVREHPIFIVAGTHEQFRTYHREKGLDRRFRYVSGPEVLKGFSNPQVEFVGTWLDRSDIQEIIMQVKVSAWGRKE